MDGSLEKLLDLTKLLFAQHPQLRPIMKTRLDEIKKKFVETEQAAALLLVDAVVVPEENKYDLMDKKQYEKC